jgi:hypothetical protein
MQLGLDADLAAEYEIEELFDDGMPGAIPPVCEGYGLDTVVDEGIEEQPEVYLEGLLVARGGCLLGFGEGDRRASHAV